MPTIRTQIYALIERRLSRILLFCGAVIIFIILLRIPATSGVFNRVEEFFTHLGTGVGGLYDRTFLEKATLESERDYYKELAASIVIQMGDVHELQSQVAALEELLSYKQNAETPPLLARIIARSVDGEQRILIDKGEFDGVKEHLAVIAQNGLVIGRVSEVRPSGSVVRLLSDPLSQIPSTIVGNNDTIGIVEGLDGFILHMRYIPQDVLIEEGSVVVTSGLDGYTPADLPIGVVIRVEKNETSPFKEAFIEPLADVREAPFVLIVDPSASYVH